MVVAGGLPLLSVAGAHVIYGIQGYTYDAAIADCTQAIALNPKYAAAFFGRLSGRVERHACSTRA